MTSSSILWRKNFLEPSSTWAKCPQQEQGFTALLEKSVMEEMEPGPKSFSLMPCDEVW